MSDEVVGTWVSRILRWALGAGFALIAFKYSDLWFLYIFALVSFVTGFMVPKRCIEDQCNTSINKDE
jgi:hypothetical protein